MILRLNHILLCVRERKKGKVLSYISYIYIYICVCLFVIYKAGKWNLHLNYHYRNQWWPHCLKLILPEKLIMKFGFKGSRIKLIINKYFNKSLITKINKFSMDINKKISVKLCLPTSDIVFFIFLNDKANFVTVDLIRLWHFP